MLCSALGTIQPIGLMAALHQSWWMMLNSPAVSRSNSVHGLSYSKAWLLPPPQGNNPFWKVNSVIWGLWDDITLARTPFSPSHWASWTNRQFGDCHMPCTVLTWSHKECTWVFRWHLTDAPLCSCMHRRIWDVTLLLQWGNKSIGQETGHLTQLLHPAWQAVR